MSAKKKEQASKPPKPPKIKKTGIIPKTKAAEKEKTSSPKKTEKVKAEGAIKNLYQLFGETQRTIEELTGIYSELPDSRHYGVGGRMLPTLKQTVISEQLEKAQSRRERLTRIIENLHA